MFYYLQVQDLNDLATLAIGLRGVTQIYSKMNGVYRVLIQRSVRAVFLASRIQSIHNDLDVRDLSTQSPKSLIFSVLGCKIPLIPLGDACTCTLAISQSRKF